MIVSGVTEENITRVRAFLEDNVDTAMFLLSNLSAYGPRLGKGLNSGNFKRVQSGSEICGVFCLTRRGNLLVETAGRTDLARIILDACAAEPIPIRGVIGEWYSADAIWQLLRQSSNFVEQYRSREHLFRLELRRAEAFMTDIIGARQLRPDDFTQWEPLNTAYLLEEGLPVQGTAEQRCANFEERALAGLWWGYLDNGHLLATAALNSIYKGTGQVGGVYTTPQWRQRGLARAVMGALLEDCVRLHNLRKVILFTGENNHAALRLYESLRFSQIGYFALLFGSSQQMDGGKTRHVTSRA